MRSLFVFIALLQLILLSILDRAGATRMHELRVLLDRVTKRRSCTFQYAGSVFTVPPRRHGLFVQTIYLSALPPWVLGWSAHLSDLPQCLCCLFVQTIYLYALPPCLDSVLFWTASLSALPPFLHCLFVQAIILLVLPLCLYSFLSLSAPFFCTTSYFLSWLQNIYLFGLPPCLHSLLCWTASWSTMPPYRHSLLIYTASL